MHRKLLIKFTFIVLGLTITNTTFAEDKILITVNQFVSHISLDAVQDGLNKSLHDRGIIPNKATIITSNAQGNISNSAQISKHHASFKPKFMVAIATAAAQTNLKARGEGVILAFAAVTDPKSANLIGQNNVIGVTEPPPIDELIATTIKIFPKLKSVGVISNSGEINSVKATESLKKILDKHKIKLKKVSITNSNDIKSAMNQLAGEVDIIYLPQDNSVVSALDNIVSISKNNKIPLIANDPSLVSKGVFLALGADYFKSGVQLGNMIADIMDGKSLEQPIQNTLTKELKINKQFAKEFGINIPNNLIEGDE